MKFRSLTLPVALALVLVSFASSAHASKGKSVSLKRVGVESTAELNAKSRVRPTLRFQPPEEDEENDRRGLPENPRSPEKSDGRSLTRVPPGGVTAFDATPALSFDGPDFGDAAAWPPDSQGDVGPTQFIAFINGRLRSYSKASGSADGVLNANPDIWWSSAMTPVEGNFATDPRIRYDRLTDRWFAVMIDVPNGGSSSNRIMIAVSSSGVITGSTTWSFYYVASPAEEFTDYPTLGVDEDALYIGTNQFTTGGSFLGTDGYVVRKSLLVAGGGPMAVAATKFDLVTSASGPGPATPQGVDNPGANGDVGYFIGVDNAAFGSLILKRVSNPGTDSPSISDNLYVSVPATSYPMDVPTSGGIALDAIDDRLYAAQMRGSRIWTSHNIGLNQSGVGVRFPTRTGSRWYEVDTNGVAGTPSLAQSGTVFDSAASNPRSYWIPSVAVNGQGSMLIGGTTAGSAAFADAWYSGRLASYASGVTDPPSRYTSSTSAYNAPTDRWGDYSVTRVDPVDDQTMWTIQEYVSGPSFYGTRIARVLGPPPAKPLSTSAAVPAGQASTSVEVTGESTSGSAFFDPGDGFTGRLAVTEGCDGVAVNSVSVASGTRLALDLDTRGSDGESCAVTVTNPDGQALTSDTAILVVEAPPGGGTPEDPTPDPGGGDPPVTTTPSDPPDSPGGGSSGFVPAPRATWSVRSRQVVVTVRAGAGLVYFVTARRGSKRARGSCRRTSAGPVRCSMRLSRGVWTVSVVARDSTGRASASTSRRVRIR